jgi:acetyl-CoA carboxylase biotin carboxyl carrier protein
MTNRSDAAVPEDGGTTGDMTDLSTLPRLISDIVETMRKAGLERLDVRHGDFKLSLRSYPKSAPSQASNADQGIAIEDDTSDPESSEAGHHLVTSPMIGTFYAAPAPGEAPFVQTGDQIEAGQVIGIVEAMKIMNEIISDRSGTVLDVLAEDGETVEYGSPLVRLAIEA